MFSQSSWGILSLVLCPSLLVLGCYHWTGCWTVSMLVGVAGREITSGQCELRNLNDGHSRLYISEGWSVLLHLVVGIKEVLHDATVRPWCGRSFNRHIISWTLAISTEVLRILTSSTRTSTTLQQSAGHTARHASACSTVMLHLDSKASSGQVRRRRGCSKAGERTTSCRQSI